MPAETPLPEQIVANMRTRYAVCSSYRDSGCIVDPRQPDDRKEFTTSFVRPDRFRFEWTERCFGDVSDQRHFMIWSNLDGVYERYSFTDYRIERVEDLDTAVAGATGISSGAAHTIYTLLLADRMQDSYPTWKLNNPSFREDVIVDGHKCYHILGRSLGGDEVQLWISKADYSLRKYKETRIVTPDLLNELNAELQRRDLGAIGDIPSSSQDQSYIDECEYTSITFDEAIDDLTFRPEFFS
jgi:hypothetical protein